MYNVHKPSKHAPAAPAVAGNDRKPFLSSGPRFRVVFRVGDKRFTRVFRHSWTRFARCTARRQRLSRTGRASLHHSTENE